MSDADDARSARALEQISVHVRELVKIHKTMNENLVEAAKDLKKFLATFDTDTEVVVYRDPAIEEILGEPETRRQRPDLFEDEEPDAP